MRDIVSDRGQKLLLVRLNVSQPYAEASNNVVMLWSEKLFTRSCKFGLRYYLCMLLIEGFVRQVSKHGLMRRWQMLPDHGDTFLLAGP